MLSVTCKPFMLSVIMLNVVVLNAFMLSITAPLFECPRVQERLLKVVIFEIEARL